MTSLELAVASTTAWSVILGEPCSHIVPSLHSPEITAAENVSVMKLKHMLQMMKLIWRELLEGARC